MSTPATTVAKTPYTFRGEGHGFFQRLTWNFGRVISRILSVLLFKLCVRGQAGLPRTGGTLLVTNHQSFLDPWLMGIAPSRQVHYMARDTLFKGGFLHWLMEVYNAFPVKRGSADLTSIRTAVERLDKGYMVNIFPEGTRSEDGTIGHIAPGISLILNRCKSDIALVPVLIDGAFEAWPRSSKFPHPHPIRIVYSAPIPAGVWKQWSPEELALNVRKRLVQLQEAIGSPYAAASRVRLAQDIAKAAAEPPRRRAVR